MAQQRLPMRKIREVLRLSAAGLSKRQIAASLGIGPTAAGACLRRTAWSPSPECAPVRKGLIICLLATAAF